MKTTIQLACALTTLLFAAMPTPAQDIPGSALSFDGVDDIVRVPFTPSLDVINAVTLEAWVNSQGGDGGIAGMWGTGGLIDKFLLHIEGGNIVARIVREGVQGQTKIVGPAAALNTWTHVALTYDSLALTLYIDGSVYERVIAPGQFISDQMDFRMGIEDIAFPGPPGFLAGQLDEVRLWSVSRKPAEMQRFFNQTVAPDTVGLIGSWRLDGNAIDQQVFDASTAANHGTLGADASFAADDPLRVASTAPVRWAYLGQGLAGSNGVPELYGEGTMVAGSNVSLVLESALENSLATLVIGFSKIEVPLKGGILVPAPDIIINGLATDATGELTLQAVWPALPPGLDFYFQYWVNDAVGPAGFAASHGLWGETP